MNTQTVNSWYNFLYIRYGLLFIEMRLKGTNKFQYYKASSLYQSIMDRFQSAFNIIYCSESQQSRTSPNTYAKKIEKILNYSIRAAQDGAAVARIPLALDSQAVQLTVPAILGERFHGLWEQNMEEVFPYKECFLLWFLIKQYLHSIYIQCSLCKLHEIYIVS